MRTIADDEVIGLFPVPLMRSSEVLPRTLVDALVDDFVARATQDNNASDRLAHTSMLRPADSPSLADVVARCLPKIADFGALLFGERKPWLVKEMWVNVLDAGGRQAMHNHANSFVSGIVYLTPTTAASSTVFMKSPGGTDFVFKNDHAGVATGPFNAEKWISPPAMPGDLVLFPSYVLHAVPPNLDGRRVSLAFNAIPARLESWGYGIAFDA